MLSQSRRVATLLWLSVFLHVGCTVTKSSDPNKRFDIKWHVGESIWEAVLDSDDELDDLGYRVNNPNADHIRQVSLQSKPSVTSP